VTANREAGRAKTILITGIGGPAGAALSTQIAERANGEPKRRWIGVDVVDVDVPHLDAFDLVALAADPDYASSMRAVFARHAPDLVIPTVSDELPQVAVLAEVLGLSGPAAGGNGHIVSSASGPTSVAWDKLLTMWALEAAGVPIPGYAPATALSSTAAAIDLLGAPFILKPRVSRGGRGVRLIESADEPWPAGDGSWIAQGFAPGTEYSPQVYRSPITGKSTVVILEKTVLKQGRIGNAAEVVRLADGSESEVEAIAARTAEALGLVGPLDMDVRRAEDGQPLLLEVNSRFGANSAYAPELLDAVLAEWLRDDM
jgi:carbamoyl-phosphate synthase large subunit